MVTLEFVVPGEPIPCPRPRVSIRGGFARAYMPGEVRAYEQVIRLTSWTSAPAGWRSDWGAYAVEIRVYRSARRGDADNFAKSVLDGLQPSREWPRAVIANDSAVHRLVVELLDDRARPRLEVTVAMLGDLDGALARSARAKALRGRR